jgi:hypothetical protein
MAAEDDFLGVVDKVLVEIEDIKEQLPGTNAQQKNDSAASAGDFEFRPLTEEEKKEFADSLNAKGKQLLAELAPKRRTS